MSQNFSMPKFDGKLISKVADYHILIGTPFQYERIV